MRTYPEFRSIEQQLSALDEDPSEALEEATCHVTQTIEYADKVLGCGDEREGEEEQDERRARVYSFVQSYLPSILQRVLKRKLSSPPVRELAMAFLKEVVRLVVHWIPLDNLQVIKLLVEIAGEDAIFYQHRRNSGEYTKYPNYAGAMSPGMDSPIEEIDTGRFTASPQYYRAPPALLELIEYFGELEGFEKVVERIKEEEGKLDLKYATWYLKIGETLRKWIKRSFLQEWVTDMKDACYGHIVGLSPDELKATSKTVLTRIIELVHVLLVEIMSKEEAGCVTESFQLDLSLKCLQSKSLEKRLQGLSAINQLIEMATRKESPPSNTYMYGQSMMRRGVPRSTDWLTTDTIIDWLKKHDIVAELFGAKMHHELLKRANEILKLFAEKSEFSLDLLDLLWTSSLGKQEATVAAIYMIIRDLLVYFSDEHFLHFYGLLRAHPLKEYDTELLLLVQKTSDCTLNKNTPEDIKRVPLEIIWNLMQDESSAVEEVFDHACQALCSIFETFAVRLDEQKVPFINRCIGNIKNSASVPQSLRLLKVLLTVSAGRRAGTSSTEELIMLLQEEVSLVALLFDELVRYEGAAKKAGTGPSTDVDSRLLPGFYTHKEHLDARLSFLNFVMRNYDVDADAVSIDQVSDLWKCLVESPLSPDDRDQAFRWLRDGCENMLLSPEVVEYVFKHRLMMFDFAQISLMGFLCFEQYFRAINTEAKKLGMGHEPERFVVVDFNLEGINSLWDIALNAVDSKIADKAVAYLCKLLDRLSPQLADSQSELRTSYITKLMTKLDEATNLKTSAGVGSAEFRILRCVVLLQKLVSDHDAKFSASRRGYGNPMNIYVKFHDGKYDNTTCISVNRTDKMHDVRAAVMKKFAARLNSAKQTVNLCVRGKILPDADYDKTASDLQIQETTLLSAKVVEKQAENTITDRRRGACFCAVDSNDPDSPRLYLSHEESCFAKLFDLLDFNQVVGEKVWELISTIPVNPEKHDAVLKIDSSTNWDDLMDTSSTFKLLYMLRIVESITIQSKPEDEEDVAIWYASFLSTKGFERLYYILIHQHELLQGGQRLPCLEALLNLVNSFMMIEEQGVVVLKETYDWISYEHVVNVLVQIIWASARGGSGARSCDADIVGHSSSLLVACLISKPELLETFFTIDNFSDFVRCALLEAKDAAIRAKAAASILQLCTRAELAESSFQPRARFVPLLLSFLSSIEPQSQVCSEYFDLTNMLVGNVLASTFSAEENPALDESSIDLQNLGSQLTSLVKEHDTVEDSKHEKVDFVLVGLMKLLSTVIAGDADVQSWCASLEAGALVQHVFHDCLFELPTAGQHGSLSPPKCKSSMARVAAFDLLTALVSCNKAGYVEVMALINEHHLSTPNRYREWNYSPGNLERAPLGYAGIKNLGCICYMNSLMQQLFMMPNFRRAILALPIPEDTEEQKKEENVTYQIQRLFTFLQETQKQCYDPIDLCKSIKDYDGNPTDVFVQMDVDEFFNVLCDKVERDLKLCGQEKLLENTWSGKVCTQLICQECKYVSERDEPYYTVSLDIKNRSNIEEALEQYVQGEMLEGDNAYFCEKCDRKVSALMRRCVKTLPSTLILHLKRFEFDFDTMRKLKLNDYLEFPMELEMKAYTKEGLAKKEKEEAEKEGKEAPKSDAEEQPDDYYKYKLMGILVHRGVADSGHYYSFIQKRSSDPRESEATWIEFNDDVVLPFDVEDIERECFGGTEELPISDTMSRHAKLVTRTQNAYMLIYERADAAPQGLEEPAKQEMAVSRKNEEDFAVASPKPLYEEVWEQNVCFLQDMKVFDKAYFAFILNLLKLSKLEPCLDYARKPVEEFAVIANSVRFLTEILVHSQEKEQVAQLVRELGAKLENHIPACIWVAEQLTEGNRLLTLLLRCTVKETRENIARLIAHVFRVLAPLEEDAFRTKEEYPAELDPADYLYDDDEMMKQSAVTLRLSEKMLSFFFTISGYWKTFSEFFLLLREIAKTGRAQRSYLFHRQVVPLIYNLVIYGSAFRLRKAPKMGDKLQRPLFANALAVQVTLLQGTAVDRSAVEGTPTEIHQVCPYTICAFEDLIEFPPHQLAMLFGSKNKLIRKAVLDSHNSAVLCRMLQYWSWNNVENTAAFVDALRTGVNDVEYDQIAPWFTLIFPYLSSTEDVLREERIARLVDGLLVILEKFRNYPKFTRNLITNLFDMYEDCEDIRDCLDLVSDRWSWVESWMAQRHFSCRTFNQSKWSSVGYYNQERSDNYSLYGRGNNGYGL